MASYKVPQDVEADDKLIGPFSFRQFIYLIIAALGIFLAWALSRIFIGLLVLPLPIIFAFLALALPLRKDQPMETYLIAMIKFFFKPRNRLWDPEGTTNLVNITAVKVAEGPQLKEFGGDEAAKRLAYLSQVIDTGGWASRGVSSSNDLSDIFLADATHAEDVLDDSSSVSQAMVQRISQADTQRLESVKQHFQASIIQPAPQQPPQPVMQPSNQPTAVPEPSTQTPVNNPQIPVPDSPTPEFNPYPSSIHQKVLSPSGDNQQQNLVKPTTPTQIQPNPIAQAQKPSETEVSPDIMRLANNNDLSISALAREANRLKDDDGEEVVISLH